MGAGFPRRPSRATFGPTLVNQAKVRDPTKEIGSATFNLSWWQLAACSLQVPLAWVLVESDGTRLSSGEVWNPNGSGALRPTVARTGLGVYTVTYAAQYDDESGTPQSLAMLGGHVTVQAGAGATDISGVVEMTSVVVATIRLTTKTADAAADGRFMLDLR